jgi:hypothetical protein
LDAGEAFGREVPGVFVGLGVAGVDEGWQELFEPGVELPACSSRPRVIRL